MKKLLVWVTGICISTLAIAQQSKPASKPAPKKTVPPIQLKNINDSASYAIGLSVANFYKQQGVSQINTSLVSRAINDVFGSKKPLFDDATANACMNSYMMGLQQQKSKGTIEAGEAFLKKNKLRPGVQTTTSGLQYEVISQGTGPKPTASDSVTCHYKGTLMDGTVFDDSYSRGQPMTFALRGVIAGWTEGLQLMNAGSKFKFYVPYKLAYGAYDYHTIPGGSMLTFEVELLDVKKAGGK